MNKRYFSKLLIVFGGLIVVASILATILTIQERQDTRQSAGQNAQMKAGNYPTFLKLKSLQANLELEKLRFQTTSASNSAAFATAKENYEKALNEYNQAIQQFQNIPGPGPIPQLFLKDLNSLELKDIPQSTVSNMFSQVKAGTQALSGYARVRDDGNLFLYFGPYVSEGVPLYFATGTYMIDDGNVVWTADGKTFKVLSFDGKTFYLQNSGKDGNTSGSRQRIIFAGVDEGNNYFVTAPVNTSCGNGVCTPGENPSSCSVDCGGYGGLVCSLESFGRVSCGENKTRSASSENNSSPSAKTIVIPTRVPLSYPSVTTPQDDCQGISGCTCSGSSCSYKNPVNETTTPCGGTGKLCREVALEVFSSICGSTIGCVCNATACWVGDPANLCGKAGQPSCKQ